MHKETFKIAPFNLDNFRSKAIRFASLITEKSGYDKFKSKERYNLLAQLRIFIQADHPITSIEIA